MASDPVEADGVRFSGSARCWGLDRAEICNVGKRRANAIAKAEFADDVPLRGRLRQSSPRGNFGACAAHQRRRGARDESATGGLDPGAVAELRRVLGYPFFGAE